MGNLRLLADGILGFYRSSYKDDEGNTKYMATTQMEPTDARRVRLIMLSFLIVNMMLTKPNRLSLASTNRILKLPGMSP